MIVALPDAAGLLPGDVVATDDYGHLGVVTAEPLAVGPFGRIVAVIEKPGGVAESFLFAKDWEVHVWRKDGGVAPVEKVIENLISDTQRLRGDVAELQRRLSREPEHEAQ